METMGQLIDEESAGIWSFDGRTIDQGLLNILHSSSKRFVFPLFRHLTQQDKKSTGKTL